MYLSLKGIALLFLFMENRLSVMQNLHVHYGPGRARYPFVCFLLLFLSLDSSIQSEISAQPGQDQISIDDGGIMHWTKDNSEVTGFGVNYTVPFAYTYRNGKKMGVDLKAAIEQDVYQFARLGLDLFRVHVWDCEISDTLGNLLQNEHLDLFDYLLAQLKKHHINAIITPIAYWEMDGRKKMKRLRVFPINMEKEIVLSILTLLKRRKTTCASLSIMSIPILVFLTKMNRRSLLSKSVTNLIMKELHPK
jgi:hypothetical protein